MNSEKPKKQRARSHYHGKVYSLFLNRNTHLPEEIEENNKRRKLYLERSSCEEDEAMLMEAIDLKLGRCIFWDRKWDFG